MSSTKAFRDVNKTLIRDVPSLIGITAVSTWVMVCNGLWTLKDAINTYDIAIY